MASAASHRINNAFDDAEEEFGDKSTEFLASIVADRMGIESDEVIAALVDVGVECGGEIPWRYSADKITAA